MVAISVISICFFVAYGVDCFNEDKVSSMILFICAIGLCFTL